MATKQELEWLQKLASQYGWADSQQFKDYVNTTAWTWTYDTLMAWLKKQASVQTAPAPTSNVWKIDTTTGQEVQPWFQRPWNANLINPALESGQLNTEKWVQDFLNTPNPNANKPPIWSISEIPKLNFPEESQKQQIQAPKIEVKTAINEALNPKWQQWVDKALESWQDVKSKLDEWLKAGTIDQQTYNQAINYLNQKNQQAWDIKEQQNNDENFIFEALQTGHNIKGTTPAYNQALNRYNKMNYYKSLSDSQLWAEIGRNLLPGTTEYNDLIKDPVFKEKLTKLQQINIAKWVKVNQEDVLAEKSYEILNNTNVNIAWTNFTLGQVLDDWYITADEMSSLTNSPVIATKAQEVEDLKNQYDEAYSLYKNLATDVKNQFKGTWATRRDIAVAVANAQEKLLPWLEALENRYTNALWTLTQMRTDSAQLFATNLGLYKEQQAKSGRMSEIEMQRKFQLEDRKYNEDLAQKQLEQKFAYEYWDINSTDPNIQRVAFERIAEDLQKQYAWMPFRRTISEMAMDFMNEYKNGKSLTDISKETTQAIQGSPAYKQWAITKGLTAKPKDAKTPEIKDFWTSDKPDWKQWNSSTWEWETIKTWTIPQVTDYYSKFRITQNAWDKSPNSKDNWYNWWTPWIDFAMPEWTDVIAFTWWQVVKAWSSWDYGTQVIVEDSQGNQHMYSHLQDWLVNVWDTIQPWQTIAKSWNTWFSTWPHLDYRVKGTYWKWQDPNQYLSTGNTEIEYTDNQIWELSYLAELQEKNPTQAAKDMKELWYTAKDLANYKAWNMPLTEKQKNSSIDVIENIKDLITNYDWSDATGFHWWIPAVAWTDRADTIAKVNQIVAKMTLPNLWQLKWPMSDKDLAFLTQASSNLDVWLSDKQFEANMVSAYNLAARRAWLPEIKSISEIKKLQTAQPTQTIPTNQWDYSEEDLLNSLK